MSLADIFNGKITKWNDPKIAATNQGVTLPDAHHHPGLSLGRVGNDQRFHHLSVTGLRRLEERSRRRRVGAMADRAGWQGQ